MGQSWRLTMIIIVGLVAMTVFSYWGVAACDFVNYDDGLYVYENGNVLAGLSIAGWRYAWTSTDCDNWHPLTWLSLELDGTLWGANPSGYHITNLVLHCANTILVFLVLWRMTGRRDLSAWTAALFAVHPLHVESVAWVSERKDVLSTFFLLLTIWAYSYYVRRLTLLSYMLVVALSCLGLLAKPMLVTLPILLMLTDFWPLARIKGQVIQTQSDPVPHQSIPWLIVEKVPLMALACAVGLITVLVQSEAGLPLRDIELDARIAHLFSAYLWYLQKTLVPTNLIVIYPHPGRAVDLGRIAIGCVLVLGISSLAFWKARTKPHLIVGWAWFLISLLPVIGILQVGHQAYADRYSYIPHIGLFMMIVWEIQSWTANSRAWRQPYGFIGILLIGVCCLLTQLQVRYWASSEALWAHTLEVMPDNVIAQTSIAQCLLSKGDYEESIRHSELACRPGGPAYFPFAYHRWGVGLLALNREAEAEEKFRAALKMEPNYEASLSELEKLYDKQERFDEAALIARRLSRLLKERSRTRPDNPHDLIRLGVSHARQGKFEQAIADFEKVIQIAPLSAPAHLNLALCQLTLKRTNEAKSNLLKAIKLNPQLAVAHFSLAKILESENDLTGAQEHFAEALKNDPNNEEFRNRLRRLENR